MFSDVFRIEVNNARRTAATFEARMTDNDAELLRSTATPFLRDGYCALRMTVPARSRLTLRYKSGVVPEILS